MSEKGLNNLIEQLQASGRADSSGVFTISAEKAREKLSQFQLAEPHDFVKNMVSAAVLGGAAAIEVSLFNQGCSAWFDGRVYSAPQLENLLQQLLSPTEPALVELAVVVNTLRKEPGTTVSLCSMGTNGEGSKLSVRGESFSVEALGEQTRAGNLMEISRAATFSRVWSGWRGLFPEQKVFSESCLHAPLRLSVNGKELQKPVSVGRSPDCIAWMQAGREDTPVQPSEPSVEWARYCVSYRTESSDGYGCVLAISPSHQAYEEALGLLNNGVIFKRDRALLGVPMAHGVLWGPLDKNVSHSDLAENEKFNSLIEWGRRNAEWLVLRRMESEVPIPEPCVAELTDWAPKLAERFQARGESESADRVKAWLAETRFLKDLRDSVRFEQLLNSLESIGDAEVLAARRRKIGFALLQAMEMSLQAANYQECGPLSLKLASLDPDESLAPRLELQALAAALCGQSYRLHGLGEAVRASLLRLEGRPSEALALLTEPLDRAQTLMALGQHRQARELLGHCAPECAESLEALSDSLAFGPERSRKVGLEALELKTRAVEMREQAGVPLGGLLQHDLARLARSVAPLTTWIKYRARASWAGTPFEEARKVEEAMEVVVSRLQRSPTALVQLHSSLLHVEKAFPLDHLYLIAVRAKSVHALRRSGYWQEADQVLVRGKLLARLLELVRPEDKPRLFGKDDP